MAMSNFLRNAILNHVGKNTSYSQPGSLYLALYTSDPTANDSAIEVSGNGYSRQAITFGVASAGSMSNSADITYPMATGSWGTVGYVGVRDASTGGNLLYSGALTNPQTVGANSQLVIKAGQLTISAT